MIHFVAFLDCWCSFEFSINTASIDGSFSSNYGTVNKRYWEKTISQNRMTSKILPLFAVLAVVAFTSATGESELRTCTKNEVCKDYCVNRGFSQYYCLYGKCRCGDGKLNFASFFAWIWTFFNSHQNKSQNGTKFS